MFEAKYFNMVFPSWNMGVLHKLSVQKSVWSVLVFLNKSIFLFAFSRRTLQNFYANLNPISVSYGSVLNRYINYSGK